MPVLVYGTNCSGKEHHLVDCSNISISDVSCNYTQNVAITCNGKIVHYILLANFCIFVLYITLASILPNSYPSTICVSIYLMETLMMGYTILAILIFILSYKVLCTSQPLKLH